MTEQNFPQMRHAMVVSQLRTTGVNDPRVVDAMGSVPRERFVPEARGATAYADAAIPLAHGRAINPPMVLGKLLNEADPRPGERVLVVGAGTGYAAAVLEKLVGPLIAIEEDADSFAKAKALLPKRVKLVEGPLTAGHQKGAPYDLILIDGAVETVPDALVKQLADGGRLVSGLVEDGVTRLAIGRRAGEGFGMVPFADAAAVILPGFAKPRSFTF